MPADIVPEPTLLADTVNFFLPPPALEPLSDALPEIAPLALALADQADVPEYPYRVYSPEPLTVREPGPDTVTLQPSESASAVGSGA